MTPPPTKKLAPSSDSLPLKLQFTDNIQQMTLRMVLMGGHDPLGTYMRALVPNVQKRLQTYLASPASRELAP